MQQEFFAIAAKDPEIINLVVHEEGHWGIAKKSNIHTFFSELVRRNLKHLMVLIVSATPYVIEGIVTHTVNWRALRSSGNMAAFTFFWLCLTRLFLFSTILPPYSSFSFQEITTLRPQPINQYLTLDIIVDERLFGRKECDNSEIILKEYLEERLHAKQILDGVRTHSGPVMALIRFSHQERAHRCAQHLRMVLGNCFVLALSAETTIRRALNADTRGRRLKLPPKLDTLMNNKKATITPEHLGELRVLLVVVGKISIGETLPKSLRFDIRRKYADDCSPVSSEY